MKNILNHPQILKPEFVCCVLHLRRLLMLKNIGNWFTRLPSSVKVPFKRIWYDRISALDQDADMIFMNYGWASEEGEAPLPLLPEDEANRYCIQLYHRAANAIDLNGLDVLEVGSGRGGGAAYIKRYLKPHLLTGLDYTKRAVDFCRTHYRIPGLSFVQGNAESLEFEQGRFDAVVNVESSHCYAAFDRFLAGVHQVLKPGGHLLLTDFRLRDEVPALKNAFRDAGLHITEEEVINPAILRALRLDNARKQTLIQAKVPKFIQSIFHQFASMEETSAFGEMMRTGEVQYLRFVLQKPA